MKIALRPRILLAGGSGFLGGLLTADLVKRGCEVVVLTRAPRPRSDGGKEIAWDGKVLGEWTKLVDGADVVVNLAGRSVNCRYHARNRQLILESRVNSTRVLG